MKQTCSLGLASGFGVLLAVGGGGALAAETGFSAVFGDAPIRGCYRRDYDRAHLASHPRQRTRSIEIGYRPLPADRMDEHNFPLQLFLFSRFKGERGAPGGGHEIYCASDGPKVGCSAEGDAGHFTLTPLGNGAIRLDVNERLTIETDRDFVQMRASDDRSFVLKRVSASACTPLE